MKKILIISTARQYEMSRQPLNDLLDFTKQALDKAGIEAEVTIAPLDELVHVIDSGRARIELAANGKDIATYDFVWLRGRFVPMMNTIALVAEYLERRGTRFANKSYAHRAAYGKTAQTHLLAHLGLPHPKTVFALAEHAAPAFVSELAFPMIVKNDHGAHGDKNYLVQNEQELERVLADNPDTHFVAQEFVPNDSDYRILLMGSQELIIKRIGSGDSHLNNTSKGATAELIEAADFPSDVIEEARTFATALHYDISGVDVMFSSATGKHYFLEVNSQPQVISGASVPEKMQLLGEYFGEQLSA